MKSIKKIFVLSLLLIFYQILEASNLEQNLSDEKKKLETLTQKQEDEKMQIKTPSISPPPRPSDYFFLKGTYFFPPNYQSRAPIPDLFKKEENEKAQNQIQDLENYQIGPGDEIEINFWGQIEDTITLTVNRSNQIFIPRLGTIEVKNMTFPQLQKSISEKINRSLKNVRFSIGFRTPREFQVHVLGAVGRPGPLMTRATQRVSDIIAQAGGLLPMSSKQFIELRRQEQVTMVDLVLYETFGNFSKNPKVTNDDVIFVSKMTEFVTLEGAVLNPGFFEIKHIRKLPEVLSLLGGLTVQADRTRPPKLSRMTSSGRKNLEIIYEEKLRANPQQLLLENVTLENGDQIFIPTAPLSLPSQTDSVFITGEVRAPGPKPYSPSITLDEYLGLAGGVTSRANLEKAMVYKKGGASTPLSAKTVIEPGDSIFIPEKTFKFWQDHLMILTTFLTLTTTVIAISR